MIKRKIIGNETDNRCCDVTTGGIRSDVIASVVPDVSKERNASIFKAKCLKKSRSLGVGEYK